MHIYLFDKFIFNFWKKIYIKLNKIENTIYKYEEEESDENKEGNDDSYKDSKCFDGIIKKNPNISLSFKEQNMSLNDDLDKKN